MEHNTLEPSFDGLQGKKRGGECIVFRNRHLGLLASDAFKGTDRA
jgi:hypothetical protein